MSNSPYYTEWTETDEGDDWGVYYLGFNTLDDAIHEFKMAVKHLPNQRVRVVQNSGGRNEIVLAFFARKGIK